MSRPAFVRPLYASMSFSLVLSLVSVWPDLLVGGYLCIGAWLLLAATGAYALWKRR